MSMEDLSLSNQHILYVTDLLTQIQKANDMVKLHQDDEDTFMVAQYQHHKSKLTKELAQALTQLDINLNDLAA